MVALLAVLRGVEELARQLGQVVRKLTLAPSLTSVRQVELADLLLQIIAALTFGEGLTTSACLWDSKRSRFCFFCCFFLLFFSLFFWAGFKGTSPSSNSESLPTLLSA